MNRLWLVVLWMCSQAVWAESVLTDSVWIDQKGQKTKLSSLRGQTTLITMLYTSCEHTCPMILETMKQVETEVKKTNPRLSLKFITASFDTKKDTPQVLKKMMRTRHLAEDRWTLLRTTDQKAVAQLAKDLKITYAEGKNGHFSHNNVIAALNSEGEVIARTESLMEGAEAIAKELKGQHP